MKKPIRKYATFISKEDIELLADIITIAKLLSWRSDVGDMKADSIVDNIHHGAYGRYDGVWVQTNEMFIRLAALADIDVDADILLDNKY